MIYIISIDLKLLYMDHNFSVIMSYYELLQDGRLDIIISEDDYRLKSFFLLSRLIEIHMKYLTIRLSFFLRKNRSC